MPTQTVKLKMPLKGYTDVPSYEAQPADYCIQALNVRPWDPLTRRLRLSQRAGLSKWATVFGTGQPIQFIRQTNLAQPATPANTTTTFNFPDARLKDGTYNVPIGTPFAFPAYTLLVAGSRINGGGSGANVWTETIPNAFGTTRYDVGAIINRGTLAGGVDVLFQVQSAAKRYGGIQWQSLVHIKIDGTTGVGTWNASITSDSNSTSSSNGTLTGTFGSVDGQFTMNFLPGEVVINTPNGNVTYNPGGTQTFGAAELTITTTGKTTAAADYQVASSPAVGYHPSNDLAKPVYLIAQNGGLNIGDPVGGFTTLGGIFSNTGEISCVDAFGKAYIVDGLNIVAVNLSAKTSAPLAASAGILPSGPRLVTLYRGRLVHSRTLADPWNWFMSKIGDPTNYDYSSLSPDGAVSGNDADAGRVGDVITALIPFADAYMVMGCPSSIYIMRGDPKAGGSIDLLSNQVGITGPRAWCQGPDGTIYFMSRHGLYRIPPGGGVPQPLSSGRVEILLSTIDFSTYQFELAWNGDDDTVWIAAIPALRGAPQTLLVWDSRTDSFWPDAYPYGFGPACMASVIGTGGALVGNNRRLLLIGGFDGVVRMPDANNFGDDGNTLNTVVRFAPVDLGGDGNTLGRILAARFNWGEPGNNFSVVYDYFLGNHPQDAALNLTSSHTKAFNGQGGYQSIDRTRVRGGAFCLQLSNTGNFGTTWSIESALIEVSEGGRMRT